LLRSTHQKLCVTRPDTLRLRARTCTTPAVARWSWPRTGRFSATISRRPFPCLRPSLGKLRMDLPDTTPVHRSIKIIINTFFVSANNWRVNRRCLTVMRLDVVTCISYIIYININYIFCILIENHRSRINLRMSRCNIELIVIY